MRRVKRLLLRGGGTLEALLKPISGACNFRTKCYNDDVTHHNYKEVCMKKAFTLAEMMVVMLILSIVLAAMAPVVTTRSKVDQSSPWRYSEGNLSDAYYGLGESQTAMIGQREFTNTDETAKLIINTSGTRPSHIAFKRGDSNIGLLRMENNAVMLGSLNNSGTLGTSAVSLGTDTKADGLDSVAVGRSAKSTASYSVAVGNLANSSATETVSIGDSSLASGNGSLALGAMSQATGSNSVAVGIGDDSISISGSEAVGIGYQAVSTGSHSTAIGRIASATNTNALAIGNSSEASEENAIAIGDARATGLGSVAIGDAANALSDYAVALGLNTNASGAQGISIGYYSAANGNDSIAIGTSANTEASNAILLGSNAYVQRVGGIAIGNNARSGATNSTVYGDHAIAIGQGAQAGSDYGISIGNNAGSSSKGSQVIAIGVNACNGVTGSNKTCIGNYSGPSDGTQKADSSTESLYFGSAGHFNSGATDIDTNGIFELHKKGNYAVAFLNADLVVNGFTWTQVGGKSGHGDAIGFFRSKTWKNQVELYNESRPGFPPESPFSDRRLKYVGKEFTSGLDKIRELKVFNYTFKQDETKEPRVGVIAQDLQKIFPDAVKKGAEGFLTIRMDDMFYAMVNAIKELDARLTALEKENSELKQAVQKMQQDNAKQEARLKALEAKIK